MRAVAGRRKVPGFEAADNLRKFSIESPLVMVSSLLRAFLIMNRKIGIWMDDGE